MSESTSDVLLKFYADTSGCAVVSAGYRLAPEFPFPAGPEDCADVAEWLVENCEREYGGALRFIGGEVRIFSGRLFACSHLVMNNLRRCYFKLRDFNEGLTRTSVLML